MVITLSRVLRTLRIAAHESSRRPRTPNPGGVPCAASLLADLHVPGSRQLRQLDRVKDGS